MKKAIYTVYINGIETYHGNHVKYLKTLVEEWVGGFNFHRAEIVRGGKLYAVKYDDKPWVRLNCNFAF